MSDREGTAAASSRYDDPEAWVSGGHEKFGTPVDFVDESGYPGLGNMTHAQAAASGRPTNPLWVGRSQDGVHFEQTFDGEPAAAEISRSPASYGWRLWRGWNVWTKTECDRCGSRYKVTSGKPRNVVRQWIVVRFGR